MDAHKGEVNRWVGAPATGAGRLSAGAPQVHPSPGGSPPNEFGEQRERVGGEARALKPAQLRGGTGRSSAPAIGAEPSLGLTALVSKFAVNMTTSVDNYHLVN